MKNYKNQHLIQFINRVSIEFRKSLGQEKSKSNLEFRYQIIVTSIKFRKDIVYLMIDTLFKKFVS